MYFFSVLLAQWLQLNETNYENRSQESQRGKREKNNQQIFTVELT